MKRYILLLFCITPLTVWAISNLKANGQGEWTVTSVPSLLQITADLSRPGAVLSGGVYADINENGILDPVDYSWNWRYGYITDGIGWIKDPANPLADTPMARSITAPLDMFERLTRRYGKPEFGITEVMVDGVKAVVDMIPVLQRPFCTLLRKRVL